MGSLRGNPPMPSSPRDYEPSYVPCAEALRERHCAERLAQFGAVELGAMKTVILPVVEYFGA